MFRKINSISIQTSLQSVSHARRNVRRWIRVPWKNNRYLCFIFSSLCCPSSKRKGSLPHTTDNYFCKIRYLWKINVGEQLVWYFQKIIHTWINVSYLFMLYLLIRCIGAHNSFSLFMFVYRTDLLYHPLSKKSVSLATLIKAALFCKLRKSAYQSIN